MEEDKRLYLQVGLPVGVAVVTFIITFFLRKIAYKRFRLWASRTRSGFDDLMVRSTRLASLLWCIWLSIYLGFVAS
jgi:hypothetical protein